MAIKCSIDDISSFKKQISEVSESFASNTQVILSAQKALKEGMTKLIKEAQEDMKRIDEDIKKANEYLSHNQAIYNSISKEVDSLNSRAKNEKNSNVATSLLKQSESKLKDMERISKKNSELSRIISSLMQEKGEYLNYINSFPKDDGSSAAKKAQECNDKVQELKEEYIGIVESAIKIVDQIRFHLDHAGGGGSGEINISNPRALESMSDAIRKAKNAIDIGSDSFNRSAQSFRDVAQDEVSRQTVNMVRDSHHTLNMATADMDVVASSLSDAYREISKYEGLKK